MHVARRPAAVAASGRVLPTAYETVSVLCHRAAALTSAMAGPTKGWYRPMYGFHPHPPAARHTIAAQLLGATMWFWLLYRAKEDGPVVLVRSASDDPVPLWY